MVKVTKPIWAQMGLFLFFSLTYAFVMGLIIFGSEYPNPVVAVFVALVAVLLSAIFLIPVVIDI